MSRKFITLTRIIRMEPTEETETMLVREESIYAIKERKSYGSIIESTGGNAFCVKESPTAILALINSEDVPSGPVDKDELKRALDAERDKQAAPDGLHPLVQKLLYELETKWPALFKPEPFRCDDENMTALECRCQRAFDAVKAVVARAAVEGKS